jgi:septum formation protein
MRHPPLVLASESPRRVSLLREIVPEFAVTPSHATELHDISIGARRLCEVNAQRKAFSVAERYPDHLVLGADTLVFLDNEPLGKPADLAEARAMLGRLAGRVHEVVTGVCLVHQRTARARLLAETTRVKFHPLTAADIEHYLAKVHVLDKAGSYALQEHGNLIVASVEGSHSNVVGLPVEAVRAALAAW